MISSRRLLSAISFLVFILFALLFFHYRSIGVALYRAWFPDSIGRSEWDSLEPIGSPTGSIQVGAHFRVMFAGDTSFGESYHPPSFMHTKGYERSVSRLRSLFSLADWRILNLETPLIEPVSSPLAPIKRYVHWGDPEQAAGLLHELGINAVSLANNHSLDFGPTGLLQTFRSLHQRGIRWVGAGSTGEAASRPLIVRFDNPIPFEICLVAGFESRFKYRWAYHFYADHKRAGVNRWSCDTIQEQVSHARAAHPDALLVAFPHWGNNYRGHTKAQQRLAHALMDAGADLVIGHGAHTLQEIERYRGRWILYSLGNCLFNSPGRYSARQALPFSLIAFLEAEWRSPDWSLHLRLYPIFSDNRRTDYRPRPVTTEERDRIREWLLRHGSGSPELERALESGNDPLGAFLVLR